MKKWIVMVAAAALLAAACSGSGADEEPSTTTPATTTVPGGGATTTEPPPPPEPYRAGVVFDGPIEVLPARTGLAPGGIGRFVTADLGDEIWIIGRQWNGTVAARSFDGGLTWTEVSFGPPPENGAIYVRHVVRGSDGRYVAIATRESSCRSGEERPGGFTHYYVCTRQRPLAFVSDDGETWTESSPAGLAPPGGSSLRIDDLIAVDDGYLAAGTIEGPGWRAVLFASPDGVTWTAEREFLGDGNPMSSRSMAFDGTTLVFTADETPCPSGPDDNVGGWQLGPGFATHGRIFVGTDIASLTLQQPGEHPLAAAPLDIPPGCGVIDGIPIAFYPYPSFRAEVVDGAVTVFELYTPPGQTARLEEAEEAGEDELFDELRTTLGSRRWAELRDGAWVVQEIAGINMRGAATKWTARYFDVAVAGRPAWVEVRTVGSPIHDVYTVSDDEPAQVQTVAPIAFSRAMGAIGADDGYLVFGLQALDLFKPLQSDDPASVVVYRTTPGEESPAGRCDLEPGGRCQFADLTEHPDYPDFSGRDLTGVDLTGTEIGSASFAGADLAGARLWLVTSDPGETPSFADADLTDAELQRAEMGDISGAAVDGASFADADITRADGVDFSNAVMFEARIADLTGVMFGDTDLTGARLDIIGGFPDLTVLDYQTIEIAISPDAEGPFEFDLSGLDLTGVSFSGWLSSDPVVITSLDGAVLAGTRFS
ncbi:MAG: pentapeptide repeat-containing protein, partial [Actinobacteria bacterium]|nr:pentapeptide repeat-containing protein [Actinomycetota bacterium]